MKTEEEFKSIAMGMAIQAVTNASVLNNELHSELQKSSNIPKNPHSVNTTWFDIAFLNLYIFRRRNPDLVLPEARERFDPILKDNFIFAVTTVGFNIKDEGILEKTKLFTGEYFDRRIDEYSKYRGSIHLLFRDKLEAAFNGEPTSKIKFMEDSKRLNLEKLLAEASEMVRQKFLSEHNDEFIFSENILLNIAKDTIQQLEEAELIN